MTFRLAKCCSLSLSFQFVHNFLLITTDRFDIVVLMLPLFPPCYGDLLESLTELMRVLIIISIFFEAQQQQQQQQLLLLLQLQLQQLQQATATAITINLHKEHNDLVCLLMDFVIRDRFCCIVISWFRRLSTIMKNCAKEV